MASAVETKQRRLRKGTTSCRECKRRKMKCEYYEGIGPTSCKTCIKRGSQCVSQGIPEGHWPSSNDDNNNNNSETPHAEGPAAPGEDGRRVDYGLPTPVSITSGPAQSLSFYRHRYSKVCTPDSNIVMIVTDCFHQHHSVENDFPSASQGKYARLSRFLHDSLPSREDMETICTASRHPSVLAHEIMTMPYTTFHQNGIATPETLLEMPEPNVHPVLISRHMLLLATFLQHLHPDLHKEIKGLSESPRAIMERLVDLAVSLVTTEDELLGSVEGLECVMIESMYQANIGNLRRSWVSGRRAMSIAQLMGLNRSESQAQYKVLDPKATYHPHHMWFRIVFLDRYLCLMLGVSQGCLDRSMASDAMLANDTPMGRLERIHCVIASRILERNEAHPSSHDTALTRDLDVELQRAARSLPSKWWLAPNLEITSTDSEALFWSTRRLFAQVLHYNLLNQLHLPYMLRSSSAEHKYEYSRITCVNASREMLSRFITLRRFNRIACSCRTVDFLALMAAMTLLLAHLDSHLSEAENLLAHQYHSDRAMIEQVQENMEEVNRLNLDALSAQSADLLRRLLNIEVETAGCSPRRARRVSVQETGSEAALPDQNDDGIVSVHIPYFGIIKFAREGMSREILKPQATTATTNHLAKSQVVDGSSTISPEILHERPQMRSSGLAEPSGVSKDEATAPVDVGYGHVEVPSMISGTYARTQAQLGTLPIPATGADNVTTHFAPQCQNGLSDPLLQYGEYPGLAAGTEDWAFQGVDLAFFESLMRSTGNEGNVGADWTTVGEVSMINSA
jgi:Fungal Zn(2)-Cys(6) binuclear cluster domain